MRLIFPLLSLSLLGGCMWARSDGVRDSSGGTYQVSARSDGISSIGRTVERAHAQALAYDEAREFCSSKGTQMFLVEYKRPELGLSSGRSADQNTEFISASIRFRCAK